MKKQMHFYQVRETGAITSRMYDFEYEATVNEYEITNITIHNTSDENFTPSEHIPMHISEEKMDAGEDMIFDYSPEFEENLAPGDSITGELVTPVEITELDDFENLWLKFETITESEIIWILPNTVK